MLSIIIALIIGAAAGTAIGIDLQKPIWGIVCGAGAYIIIQIIISLILRKKINALQLSIQSAMNADRERINRQLMTFQQRQPGNMAGLKQLADRLQGEVSRKLLAETEKFRVFFKWSPLLYKQINAMKLQLHYQLKEFAEVDRLLPKSMLVDPLSVSIKLVRLYKNEDDSLDSFFNKKCTKFKSDDRAFLASVYAWIKLKQQQPEKAMAALTAARKLSDNPVMIQNLDKIANGRHKDYSNAGFGEQWYALGLEDIKPKQVRRRGGHTMY